MTTRIGDRALQRGLPADPDVEAAVLACCLLAGEVPPEVADMLTPASFLIDSNRAIFGAMLTLHAAEKPIDYLTLEAELRRVGDLERVGGLAGLIALGDAIPIVSHIAHYAEIVAEKQRLRMIIEACNAVALEALEAQNAASDIAGRAAALMMDADTLSRASDALTMREALADPSLRRRLLDPHRNQAGITTGFPKLDEYTGGFSPGELTIVAARPSTGKTAFALGVAAHAARQAPVLFVTLESTREALFQRLISQAARVDWARRRYGRLDDDEKRRVSAAIHELSALPLHVADMAGATVERVVSLARKLKAKNGLGLVVVDYLQLLATAGKVENRTQEVAGFSRGLSRLAHELEVSVVALSQLSRDVERRSDPRPRLSDLRESGSLEQDADRVLFLFRGELYENREDLKGFAEIDIAKQRDGALGVVEAAFIAKYTKFEPLAEGVEDYGGLYE